MSRNIVVCCDGTNNQFGPHNTNVVRLIQSLERDLEKQLIYYDPGVGTLSEPGLGIAAVKWISKVVQLMFGRGLIRNVAEAYTFLMNYSEPGDEVFLFGFSRGAYTVRVLAGMLHMLGLLPPGNENLVPYLQRLYKSIRQTTPETAKKQWQVCDDFRRSFARSTGHDRHFQVHFLGVWDTVSSVGWIREPATFPYTSHNPSVRNIWHAVSIDERRAFFRTNLMEKDTRNPAQVLNQRWFPGDHSDVGGGHSEGGLWRAPFSWIAEGARTAGLRLDDARLRTVLSGAQPPFRPWSKPHDLLKGWWKVAELIPKQHWDYKKNKSTRRCNCCRSRFVPNGSLIDQSALYGSRENGYRPKNLSPDFIKMVEQLPPELPDELEYQRTQS